MRGKEKLIELFKASSSLQVSALMKYGVCPDNYGLKNSEHCNINSDQAEKKYSCNKCWYKALEGSYD